MPILSVPLSPQEREYLQDLSLSMHLDGHCYEFAVALSQLTGWPIVALRTPEHNVRHAAVRDPEGNLYDARGKVDAGAFGKPFNVSGALDLREVTLEDLCAVRPVFDRGIARATQIAETLFPELVRIPSERAQRTRAFMEELEALSRKHKIWIRAPYPTTKPCLAQGEDDEAGYLLTPSTDGNTFFIDRLLKGQKL
jgi:hypothetical protein